MVQSLSINIVVLVLFVGDIATNVNAWIPSTSLTTQSSPSNLINGSGARRRWTHSLSPQSTHIRPLGLLWSSTSDEAEDIVASISKLRVSEIKQELEALKVDYTDCFDKESMVARLLEARNRKEVDGDSSKESPPSVSSSEDGDAELDEQAELEKIRSMRVKELREELGRRRIPRAGLFDKEDLVQALWKAKQLESVFSPSGKMLPGCVADLSGDEVEQELQHTSTPLLLDVYATWCGPCQMVAGYINEVAQESFSGSDESKPLIRVAKMDSDANPQMASQLKVAGLPTIVLFQHGEEIDRIEGAPTKDQLVEWVTLKLQE